MFLTTALFAAALAGPAAPPGKPAPRAAQRAAAQNKQIEQLAARAAERQAEHDALMAKVVRGSAESILSLAKSVAGDSAQTPGDGRASYLRHLTDVAKCEAGQVYGAPPVAGTTEVMRKQSHDMQMLMSLLNYDIAERQRAAALRARGAK